MAIDSRDKRASTIAGTLLWLVVAPIADSDLDTTADRQQVAGIYRGIDSSVTALPDVGTTHAISLIPVRHATSLIPVRHATGDYD